VDTLYVQQGRVGINTLEPTNTLSIWDQEVEFVLHKHSQDTGILGTARHQRLILSAGAQQNIVLNPDGVVEIERLQIGAVRMSSGNRMPNWNGVSGEIIWNDTPSLGQPVGWVCLGGARWASFGRLEDI